LNMPDIKTTRKIQLTGGSTYIVSLPKEWVKYFNLKAGDEVDIRTDPQMRLSRKPQGAEGQGNEGHPSGPLREGEP